MMSVRVRSAEGQEKSRFYLHGVELRKMLKEQSREVRLVQDAGSEVGWSSGANPRDVFRVAKKAFAVKDKKAEGQKRGSNSDLLMFDMPMGNKNPVTMGITKKIAFVPNYSHARKGKMRLDASVESSSLLCK